MARGRVGRVVYGVLKLFQILLFGWVRSLGELVKIVCKLLHGKREEPGGARPPLHCFPVNHPAIMRPDPLLYSQRSLIAQGLAVTWNNPDIVLFKGGVPVSSSELETSTTYDVQIRVWNNSLQAPVVHMPVHLSFLDFGIGTTPIPVGSTTVDVGVKGSASQPALATVPWTTPSTPGHYCLQALLDPADDLDYSNNLGQENTDVAEATSPAVFRFTLRNNTKRTRQYRFELDSYVIPDVPDCGSSSANRGLSLARHRQTNFPVPPGFAIDITPSTPALSPGAQMSIHVTAAPPTGFVGRQPINVNCFHDGGFAGGVSLVVKKGV
jgi:hypothetical protein